MDKPVTPIPRSLIGPDVPSIPTGCPDSLPYAVRRRLNEATALLQQGRVGTCWCHFLSEITRRDVLGWYLHRRYPASENGLVTAIIDEHELLLDVTDPGVCRTLLAFGMHETGPRRTYLRRLRRAARSVNDPCVMEIGANIGYFTMESIEATRRRAQIYAFEPDPRNRTILRHNVMSNDVLDRVVIEEMAIGGEDGVQEFGLSNHSNLNRLIGVGGSPSRDSGMSIEVPVRTIDRYVYEHDVDPSQVIGVRMDVEGHEARVCDGMHSILRADGPLVVYFEVHPWILGDDHERLLELLIEHGFELVSAERGIVYDRPCSMAIGSDDLADLVEIPHAYALIAEK